MKNNHLRQFGGVDPKTSVCEVFSNPNRLLSHQLKLGPQLTCHQFDGNAADPLATVPHDNDAGADADDEREGESSRHAASPTSSTGSGTGAGAGAGVEDSMRSIRKRVQRLETNVTDYEPEEERIQREAAEKAEAKQAQKEAKAKAKADTKRTARERRNARQRKRQVRHEHSPPTALPR